MHRRGEAEVMAFEIATALLFLAAFVGATFMAVGRIDFGDRYFSEFHAQDLATLAEIANAPQGDVTLRYDNLRGNLPLRFAFSNGRIAVGEEGFESVAYYGAADSYPLGAAVIEAPEFLALQKSDGRFAIHEIALRLAACPAEEAPDRLSVSLSLSGALTEADRQEIVEAFEMAAQSYGIRTAEAASLPLEIEVRAGSENSFAAGGSLRYSCLFKESLESLTNLAFTNSPSQDRIVVTVRNDATLTNRQLANALSFALAQYG